MDKFLERGRQMAPDDKYPYRCISPEEKENAKKTETIVLDEPPNPSRGSSVSYVYVGSRESSRMGDFIGEIGEDVTGNTDGGKPDENTTIVHVCDSDKSSVQTVVYCLDDDDDDMTLGGATTSTSCETKLKSSSRPSSKSSTNTDALLEEMAKASQDKEEHKRPESVTSTDSITQELLHFKPIHVCPKTPPKRMPSGRLMEPKLVRSTPVNLSRASMDSPSGPMCSPHVPGGSPIMQRRLQELAAERQNNVSISAKIAQVLLSENDVSSNFRQASLID